MYHEQKYGFMQNEPTYENESDKNILVRISDQKQDLLEKEIVIVA